MSAFKPVTNIINFSPTQAIVGQEVELTATVQPADATNRVIDWSLVSGNVTFRTTGSGTTKRTFMTANTSQTHTLRATIRNGQQG